MRYNFALCFWLLCFLLGGLLAGCKSVATSFHRMHNELTSDLIKEDSDEDSHYYGAWFISSPPLNSRPRGDRFGWPASKQASGGAARNRYLATSQMMIIHNTLESA